MTLFIKPWCPWCIDAVAWLDKRGIAYTKADVLGDSAAMSRMKAISGQTRAPTLELPDGSVLADFDTGQLEKFLKEHKVEC